MKYLVNVVKYGTVEVETQDEEIAVQIAGESIKVDEVSWDGELHVLSVEPLGE